MASGGSVMGWECWPAEPPRLGPEDVDRLLAWCVGQGATDITFQSDQPVYIEVDGRIRPVTRRSLDSSDMNIVLTRMYQSPTAAGHLADGRYLDFPYLVAISRDERLRFRVNATGILSEGRDGVQITARSLPVDVPLLSSLNLEPAIIRAVAPRNGLVAVTGPTGSGKSYLLAAVTRYRAEELQDAGKILTYEDPIEFVHEYLDPQRHPHSLVAQSTVGRNVSSFGDAIRNALRRKPGMVLVGEARDADTIGGAILASQTGHPVYTTAHTIGPAETLRRMISVFPAGEQIGRAFDLLDCLRLVVTQILVPKVGGGRIGLREFLVFTPQIREALLDMPVEQWTGKLREYVVSEGQTLADAARRAHGDGLISEEWLRRVVEGGIH